MSVGFGAAVGQHVVAGAAVALGPQRRQVDRGHDDLLAGAGVGLGQRLGRSWSLFPFTLKNPGGM